MNIPNHEVDDMNMLKNHERSSNHRSEEEGMDMTDIHMMEVEDMDMVKEHPSKKRLEVEGVDTKGMDMMEVITMELDMKVVEREHEARGVDKSLDR
jgi:hypothetical protein